MIRVLVAGVFWAMCSGGAYAQDVKLVQDASPELAEGSLNAGDGVAVVHAGTDKKIAFVRIKKRNFGQSPWQWDLAFQAPYDTDSDPSVLGNFDGLTKSTNLQLGLQRIDIINAPASQELNAELDQLCVRYGFPAGEGCTDGEVKEYVEKKQDPQRVCAKLSKAECSVRATAIATKFKEEERRIQRLLEAQGILPPLRAWIFGVDAKVGVEQFKFLDAMTFVEQKDNKSPWSLNAYVYYKRGPSAYGGGIEYQDAYKAQSEVSVCMPSEINPAVDICRSGRLGSPLRQRRKLAFLQFNHHRAGQRFAIAPRLTFDFEKDETGFSLPVYLIRNDKGSFTGGFELGWQSETDEVIASFFVGKAFTYF